MCWTPHSLQNCNDPKSLQHFQKIYLDRLNINNNNNFWWRFASPPTNCIFASPLLFCNIFSSQKHQKREALCSRPFCLPPTSESHGSAWDSSYIYFSLMPSQVTSDCYSNLEPSKIVSCISLYCQKYHLFNQTFKSKIKDKKQIISSSFKRSWLQLLSG